MARKAKSLLAVPQTGDTWYCAVRRLRTWVRASEKSEEYYRPFVLISVHLNTGNVLVVELMQDQPTPELLQKRLFRAMTKPERYAGIAAHRPAEIHFEDEALAEALKPLLSEAQVQVLYQPQRQGMDDLLAELQASLGGPDEVEFPGLLKKRGVTPAQVEQLFSAAVAFYHAEPWVQLSNDDVLSVQVQPRKEPFLVIVMGQGGQEYGLSLFRDWEELESTLTSLDPMAALSGKGRHAFLYNAPPYVSFDDLDAIEQYGWELPAPDIYPVPMVYTSRGIERPDAAMLRWYEAALRAIPLFVKQNLGLSSEGGQLPAEANLTVTTSAGEVKVHIRYPAGDLTHLKRQFAPWLGQDESDFEGEGGEAPVISLRATERYLAEAIASMEGVISPIEDPALKRAQELMYDAWAERQPKRRIALARRALETSPNCADAYVLLAEEEATSSQQALELYAAGVQAGRRALGEAFFRDPENIGHFWGILETRPFMRALEGLAGEQWNLDRREEALANYRELLRLNPNDNQGIRYLLLQLLLELGREDEAQALLKDYEDDWSADWAYTTALLAFRRGGDSPLANRALERALEVNHHVPSYLVGKKRIPPNQPEYITMGGPDEAAEYAAVYLNDWRKTPGAVEWVRQKAGIK